MPSPAIASISCAQRTVWAALAARTTRRTILTRSFSSTFRRANLDSQSSASEQTTQTPSSSPSPIIASNDSPAPPPFQAGLSGASPDLWNNLFQYPASPSLHSTLAKNGPRVLTAAQRWEDHSRKVRAQMVEMKPDAGKYAGRSEQVTAYTTLQAALGRLGRTLAQNNVRKELRAVERYEKPTDKRRRLKSERHRRRFADMIAQKVRVVREISARGG